MDQSYAYADIERPELEAFIPRDAASVCEAGSAWGGFGRTLRRALGSGARLVAVEPQESAARASEAVFDEVHVGLFPDALAGVEERFDLLCFNDVLEHMTDPWSALAEARRWLTPGGRVLASVPNVQYGPHVERLLRGRWDYTDVGILDRTHLRFFTRASIEDLFTGAGFTIERLEGINSAWQWDWAGRYTPTLRAAARHHVMMAARRAALTMMPDARWLQFAVVARLN